MHWLLIDSWGCGCCCSGCQYELAVSSSSSTSCSRVRIAIDLWATCYRCPLPFPFNRPSPCINWFLCLMHFQWYQPHFKHFWWVDFFLFIEPRVKSGRIIFPEWCDNFPNFVPIKWKTTASNSIIAIEIVQNQQPIVKMCTTFRAIGKSENWQSIYESNENVVWHCGIA